MRQTFINRLITVCLVGLLTIASLEGYAQGAPCDCTGLTGADLTACQDACGDPNDVPLDDYLPLLGAAGGLMGLYFLRKQKLKSY